MAREAGIGICVTAVAVAAMVADHWLGDEQGVDDPGATIVSVALCLAVAALLFGRVIPRTKAAPDAAERAARVGLLCSVLGIVTLPVLFLGVCAILGGAGIALGLLGRQGSRRRLATAAIVLGALPVLAVAAYAIQGGESPDDD